MGKSAPSAPPPIIMPAMPERESSADMMLPMMEMMSSMMSSFSSMSMPQMPMMPQMPQIQMPSLATADLDSVFRDIQAGGKAAGLKEIGKKRGLESTILTSLLDETEPNVVQGSVLSGI